MVLPEQDQEETKRLNWESSNAQLFHQDQEFITFLKVFLYLSDVDENSGPHVYVRGSALDYEERLGVVEASRRFSDETITTAFGAERIASITGPKGQIVLANTRGFHKGSPVISGHRLILQIEYASSLYSSPIEPFDVSSLTRELLALRAVSPRIS